MDTVGSPGEIIMLDGPPEKSSLQKLYESRVREMSSPAPSLLDVSATKGKADFNGEVDGAGYKGSMDDPKKPPLTLVSKTFIWMVARILGFGAKKYARGNWMRGMMFSEVLDGILRHLTAWNDGEDNDPESGMSHLAHAACGLMFLLEFTEGKRREQYLRFDDRVYAR